MLLIDYFDSPIGWLKLEANDVQLLSISHIKKPNKNQLKNALNITSNITSNNILSSTAPENLHNAGYENLLKKSSILVTTKKQLSEYFQNKLTHFDLPLAFDRGTEFQQTVWRALQQIPFGETRTYKQIAEMINKPKAVRAVGGANNKNPFSIVVPCHRVIGANGSLVGYAGGLQRKQFLLDIESTQAL